MRPLWDLRIARALGFFVLLLATGCASPSFNHLFASGHYSPEIVQCVPYARNVSGIRIYGDAYSWWWQARGRYRRGIVPVQGAVLVLKRTAHMRFGHVAVVRDVLGPRQINVTHSNWGSSYVSRHIVYDSMLAQDVSAANDWSQVRFWNDAKGVMGFPYAAYGFIYP